MSAFMHETAHIDALVDAGLNHTRYAPRWEIPGSNPSEYRDLTPQTATELGRTLLRENAESMAYRYDMKDLSNPADDGTRSIEYLEYLAQADEYHYTPKFRKRYTPEQMLLALSSYEYQSCEHPGWNTSEANAFCSALRLTLISALPGYQTADTWTIDA